MQDLVPRKLENVLQIGLRLPGTSSHTGQRLFRLANLMMLKTCQPPTNRQNQVEGAGITHRCVCSVLGCSKTVLDKAYATGTKTKHILPHVVLYPSLDGATGWLRDWKGMGIETGWEAGIRTPINRSRVCCPTVERPPSETINIRCVFRDCQEIYFRRSVRKGADGSVLSIGDLGSGPGEG